MSMTVESIVATLAQRGECAADGGCSMELGQVGLYALQLKLGALSKTLLSWYRTGNQSDHRQGSEAAAVAVAAIAVAINFAGRDALEPLLQKELERERA